MVDSSYINFIIAPSLFKGVDRLQQGATNVCHMYPIIREDHARKCC